MKNPEINKDLLIQEWVINRLSQREMAEKYSVSLGLIETRIKKFGLIGARDKIKYPLNEEHLDYNSPVFWYLLGLIVSDGYIDEKNLRVVINLTNDFETLEKLSSYYSTNKTIPVYRYKVKNGYRYSLTLSDKKLIEMLHELEIYGESKTYNVFLPDPQSKFLFCMMLRGFIDGDGSIRYGGNCKVIQFSAYIESEKLLQSICNLYYKYFEKELAIYSVKDKSGKSIQSLGDSFIELMEIYEELPSLSIQRKRNIIQNKVNDIVHAYEMINHRNW